MNALLLILSIIQCLNLTLFFPRDTRESIPIKTDTVFFEKGSTLAFLVGIVKPEAMEARNKYFQTIFPIASKYQYNLGVAFNVIAPTRGNYHPGFVAIASWPAFENRMRFLKDPQLPENLADQRRSIWARFDQTFYENIAGEIKFEVHSDKIYVFTNYWVENQPLFDVYLKHFTSEMPAGTGRVLVLLEGGKSPKDHMYEPDAVVISEWVSQDAFRQYLIRMNQEFPEDGVKNTNEFITSYVFGFGS